MIDSNSRFSWLVDLGQFGAWILTSVAAIFDALYIRAAVQAILRALRLVENQAYNQKGGIGLDIQFGFALSAVDNFLLLIFGCAALAFTIAIEYYFRKGRPKGLLLRRFIKVFLIELAIFAVSILIMTVI